MGIIYDNKENPFNNDSVNDEVFNDITPNEIQEAPELENSASFIEKPQNNLEEIANIEDDGKLSAPIQKLLDDYLKEIIAERKSFTPIYVDEIASRLARFYEKIRKIIDWKDDNALRRNAIERTLKRILFPNLAGITVGDINPDELSETLTLELIRGGHLPNGRVPRERLGDVAHVLKKYLYFLEYLSTYKPFEVKRKINYTTFVLEIAACELEEILTNPAKEYGMINAMASILEGRITVTPQNSLSARQIKENIFIATLRALYGLDDNFIIYIILKGKYENWHNPNPDELKKITQDLPETWREIELNIQKPIVRKFTGIAERVDTVFVLLDDVLAKLKTKPKIINATFESRVKLKKLLKEAYEKRYQTLKTRLFRLAVFSTLSVFLSNWFTYFVVEVPLARLFYEGFNTTAAIVDFVVPTLLMFLLVAIIRPPGKDNIKRVMSLTNNFVYKGEELQYFQVRSDKGKASMLKIVLTAIYFEIILLAFAGIAYIFYIANLPITSVIFDTFTISLTVFAAVAIKNKSKELSVNESASTGEFILDMISVPIAKVGSIFAKKWKEYNVVAILFNFVVETPFAVVLNVVQGWSEFINERKSELH